MYDSVLAFIARGPHVLKHQEIRKWYAMRREEGLQGGGGVLLRIGAIDAHTHTHTSCVQLRDLAARTHLSKLSRHAYGCGKDLLDLPEIAEYSGATCCQEQRDFAQCC